MSRLGVFSVTSFHSLVSCRENTSNVHLGTGAKVKRSKSGAGNVYSLEGLFIPYNSSAPV